MHITIVLFPVSATYNCLPPALVTGTVGECLQAGTEQAPVLDCPAPLRRLPDSGAGYKYPDLLTYFQLG